MIYGWTPMSTPPEKTGCYIVAHRGNKAESCHYLNPNDKWMPGTVTGWQKLPEWRPTHWMAIIWPEQSRAEQEAIHRRCPHLIPAKGPAQCQDGHWLGSPEHPIRG